VHKLLTSGYNFNWTISITPAWAQRKWKNYKHQQIFGRYLNLDTSKGGYGQRESTTSNQYCLCLFIFVDWSSLMKQKAM
jgi:hypothetical protein